MAQDHVRIVGSRCTLLLFTNLDDRSRALAYGSRTWVKSTGLRLFASGTSPNRLTPPQDAALLHPEEIVKLKDKKAMQNILTKKNTMPSASLWISPPQVDELANVNSPPTRKSLLRTKEPRRFFLLFFLPLRRVQFRQDLIQVLIIGLNLGKHIFLCGLAPMVYLHGVS